MSESLSQAGRREEMERDGKAGDRNHPSLGAKHWCLLGKAAGKRQREKKNKRGVE